MIELYYFIDSDGYTRSVEHLAELTEEDVRFFIRCGSIDYPDYEELDLESWEELLMKNEPLYYDIMRELHFEEARIENPDIEL